MTRYLFAAIILAGPCGSMLLAQMPAPASAGVAQIAAAASRPALKLTFPIGEGAGRGDGVYLPVSVGGKERLFLLDTGLTETLLNAALVKELKLKSLPATTMLPAQGDVITMEQYATPAMILGGETLVDAGPAVLGRDLEGIRKVVGSPIDGVLGMDVLRNYVMRLDFKERRLEIGDLASGREAGEPFAIDWDAKGSPRIAARFFNIPDVLVLLDTGNNGMADLNQVIVDRLPPGEAVDARKSLTAVGGGNVMATEYQVTTKWSLAGTTFHELYVDESRACSMGLGMMRYYIVTFDFPRNSVYLRSIEPVGRDQPRNAIHLVMEGKRVLVDSVEEGILDGGLEAHDEIVRVDGKDVAEMQLWAVREHLATAEHTTLTIRRGNPAKELTLQVDGRYPQGSGKGK